MSVLRERDAVPGQLDRKVRRPDSSCGHLNSRPNRFFVGVVYFFYFVSVVNAGIFLLLITFLCSLRQERWCGKTRCLMVAEEVLFRWAGFGGRCHGRPRLIRGRRDLPGLIPKAVGPKEFHEGPRSAPPNGDLNLLPAGWIAAAPPSRGPKLLLEDRSDRGAPYTRDGKTPRAPKGRGPASLQPSAQRKRSNLPLDERPGALLLNHPGGGPSASPGASSAVRGWRCGTVHIWKIIGRFSRCLTGTSARGARANPYIPRCGRACCVRR